MSRVLVGVGLAAVLAVPSLAQAQDQKVEFRPMVGGVAGAGPGASYSAAISFKAGDKMKIFGEFGRLQNILPNKVGDQVEVAAALAANGLNAKSSSHASANASFGMFGVRRALRDVSGAHTAVEIGVGVAHVTSDVDAVLRGGTTTGDISNLVHTAFTNETPENKAMVALGYGITLGVNKTTAVEMGARYIRVFTDSTAINMANIYGGFRFAF